MHLLSAELRLFDDHMVGALRGDLADLLQKLVFGLLRFSLIERLARSLCSDLLVSLLGHVYGFLLH